MYFPYLRGRQYELLALYELAKDGLLGQNVIPVVEPIKLTATFNGTIKQFLDTGQSLALVLNPTIGDLANGSAREAVLPFISKKVIPAVIMNNDAANIIIYLSSQSLFADNILVIMTNRDFLATYYTSFNNIMPKYTLVPDERQMRRTIQVNKVLFEDKFKKQDRIADYLKQIDEFYSDDHIYYKEEKYVGFGDYSIIGNEYLESGFAPYAVAFHIVYFDSENILRVHHFVSDSNLDTTDVAGKYHEAIMKLKKWYDTGQSRQLTTGLSILLSHATDGYYPGLSTIKKLTIMHHLELVGKYLDGAIGK